MVNIKDFEKKETTKKIDISKTLTSVPHPNIMMKKPVSKYQITNDLDKFENILIKKRSSIIK